MRLAIVLHAASSPGSRDDARLLGAALRARETGFEVVDLPGYEDAATSLPGLLARVRTGSFVLVAVLARLVDHGGRIGIEGGARDLSLAEIASALAATGADALLVVDGVLAETEDLASVAGKLARSLSGTTAIVGLRRPPALALGLSRLIADVLAEPAVRGAVVQVSTLVHALGIRPDLAQHVDLFAALGGRGNALIAARSLPAPTPSPDDEEEARRALASGDATSSRRVEALLRLAATHAAAGDATEAAFHVEKALGLDPAHRGALEASLAIAARDRRWEEVLTLGERLLSVIEAPGERVPILLKLARLWQDEARDDVRATSTLQSLRLLSPRTPEVLERLIALHDRARRFVELTEVLRDYAGLARSPRERAARLSAAAQIAGSALADRPLALALYDEALACLPGDPELQRARRELVESALSQMDRDDD